MTRVIPILILTAIGLSLAGCKNAVPTPSRSSPAAGRPAASHDPATPTPAERDDSSPPAMAEIPSDSQEIDVAGETIAGTADSQVIEEAEDVETTGDRLMSLILEQLEVRSRLRTAVDPAVRSTLEARDRALTDERAILYAKSTRTQKELKP